MKTTRPPKPPKTPELAAAESGVLGRLHAGDYDGASRIMAAYEARQPNARGIGVNWSRYDTRNDVVALESIFASAAHREVQLAAAMMWLWGASKPRRRWLSAEARGDDEAHALVMLAYKARAEDLDRRNRAVLGL